MALPPFAPCIYAIFALIANCQTILQIICIIRSVTAGCFAVFFKKCLKIRSAFFFVFSSESTSYKSFTKLTI